MQRLACLADVDGGDLAQASKYPIEVPSSHAGAALTWAAKGIEPSQAS